MCIQEAYSLLQGQGEAGDWLRGQGLIQQSQRKPLAWPAEMTGMGSAAEELVGEPGGTMLVRTVEAGAWSWSGWSVDLPAPGQNWLQKVLPVDRQTLWTSPHSCPF